MKVFLYKYSKKILGFVEPIVYITLKVNHELKSTIVKTMSMSHDMSKGITKVLAKATMITHYRVCAQCINTIFKTHIYKLKVIPTYGKCWIVIPSVNKKQHSVFVEELEVKSWLMGIILFSYVFEQVPFSCEKVDLPP